MLKRTPIVAVVMLFFFVSGLGMLEPGIGSMAGTAIGFLFWFAIIFRVGYGRWPMGSDGE